MNKTFDTELIKLFFPSEIFQKTKNLVSDIWPVSPLNCHETLQEVRLCWAKSETMHSSSLYSLSNMDKTISSSALLLHILFYY